VDCINDVDTIQDSDYDDKNTLPHVFIHGGRSGSNLNDEEETTESTSFKIIFTNNQLWSKPIKIVVSMFLIY